MIYSKPRPILNSHSVRNIDDECWKQQELKVSALQKVTKGKGAVLCFLDDGIGINTELLNLNIDRWSYFETGSGIGSHSTFGATVIAGKNLGIFPEMSLVSKQVLDPDSGLGGSAHIVSAIYAAKDMGIKTINLSLGSNYPDPEIERALKVFCSDGISIATIASGNDGPQPRTSDYPANYAKTISGVLSVAATQIERNGEVKVAMFSSRGIVNISAPGHGLKSMDHESRIDLISGTSFSSPIVGAAIAVARTLVNRDITQDEILSILQKTAIKIDIESNVGAGKINILEFFTEIKKLNGTTPNQVKKPRKWYSKICDIFK